jgi:hypothetical protein
VNTRPNTDTPGMPKNLAVPSTFRISAPAPVARVSGSMPSTKAEGRHQDRPRPRARGLHRR